MTGYSGTPLAKKLGIKSGQRIYTKNAPDNYQNLLEPIPEDVLWLARLGGHIDMVHCFATQRKALERDLTTYRTKIAQDGMIWVSWPKRSSKVETDITEDVIRDVALPMGLVDVKVCAVDETWSGLKLVIRKELRKKGG